MPSEKPHLLKHLEFVQLTIVRMAANSFIIKGWTVTLVAAILAFTSKDGNPRSAFIALIPAILFWGLDAYFLRTERLYRALYDAVRESRSKEDSDVDFTLDATPYANKSLNWWRVCLSKTLLPFYLSLTLVIGLICWLGFVQG